MITDMLPPTTSTDRAQASLLLVEDDAGHAALVRDGLVDDPSERPAYRLTHVETVRAGADALKQSTVDLAIVDCQLPDGRGLDLVPLALSREIPVILMTSQGSERIAVEALRAGALDYIVKSDEVFRDMRHVCQRALREWEHLQERRRTELALRKTNDALKKEVRRRREVEYALRERENKYHALYELSPDIVLVVNADNGRILSANHASDSILGRQPENLYGLSFLELFVDGSAPDLSIVAEESGEASYVFGARHVLHADGRVVPMDLTATHMPWGEREAMLVNLRDVRERVEAERALHAEQAALEQRVEERTRELRESLKHLEAANKCLAEADRHKSLFLSSMSHELRTPLNAILGFTDLLGGCFFGELNLKQADYVSRISESGKHLLALISDLLDVARIDAGAMRLDPRPMAVSELISSAEMMVHESLSTKRIALEIDIPDDLPDVPVDARKGRQIVLNLLTNAIKYTPAEGRVSIRAAVDATEPLMRIEVEDTGVGISPEEQEHIFNEFHQAEAVRDEELGGVGIGLALTRRLVNLHGGHIGVSSRKGIGSRFWFTLPLELERAETAESKPEAEAPTHSREVCHKARILIAEDNRTNQAMLQDMLELHGHEVLVAQNGLEAIDVAQLRKPHLVLMDVHMPVLDGLEATRRLRSNPHHADLPIVAVTASAGPDAEATCLAAGCSAHLSKPVRLELLTEVLDRFLSAPDSPDPAGSHPAPEDLPCNP